jgi:quercetin dioxygenase-like cupin family protein
MPTATLVTETLATAADEAPTRPAHAPLLAMLSGLLLLALAATVLVHAGRRPRPAPRPTATATAVPAPPAPGAPLAITLSARDVSVVTQVYAPGRDSGWHTHPGIHAVAVLSGTLTVYDSECRRQTFGPGRPYVGGQELHLARNETDAPVEMTVTYLSPSAPTTSTQHMAAPAGCTVGAA